jgi:hypothetical protein
MNTAIVQGAVRRFRRTGPAMQSRRKSPRT